MNKTPLDKIFQHVEQLTVVNRNYEMVYSSRFDPGMGKTPGTLSSRNFYDVYPFLKRDDSTIAEAMSTGNAVYRDRQSFVDQNGRKYLTRNLTIPIMEEGRVIGAIELSNEITTVGDRINEQITCEGPQRFFLESNIDKGLKEEIIFKDILTVSEKVQDTIEQAKIFAENANPVLIYGETGTGKELFAQAMINYIRKPRQKIIVQNCAAVPDNLIESILFGTTKGSYTGAENSKGLFEEADGGIMFLDELNSLPYAVQGKLLRVLQDGTFRSVGGNQEKKVDVKIIAAMNIDPIEAIEHKILRKDLFYRLSGNMIYVPPLRERPEDVEFLLSYYIRLFNYRYGKSVKDVSPQLREFLLDYGWEGNVRELKHVMETMIALAKEDILHFNDLPAYLNRKNADLELQQTSEEEAQESSREAASPAAVHRGYDLRSAVEAMEREMIVKTLIDTGGNKTKAAELLGIPRQTMKYKMKKLGIIMDNEDKMMR